jgi:signal transduction histidine kinase
LPWHEFSLPLEAPGHQVTGEFERQPDLPGVIVCRADGTPAAMISRVVFFQRLSRPFCREIFLNRPVRLLVDKNLPEPLVLTASQKVADAAVLALEREPVHAYEPLVVRPAKRQDGPAAGLRLVDVYDLLRAQTHLLGLAQAAMLQSEKLASVGQLAAGVAHEVNNPLSFVGNNLAVLQRDAGAVGQALALYRRADASLAEADPALRAELDALDERFDLSYTAKNLCDLASRSREGVRRIQEIVRDLREFARLDLGEETDVDVNAGITSTANMIAGRARSAGVTVDLQLSAIPTVSGNPGKVNQVVMNLLANAVDACHPGGQVTVRSMRLNEAVSVEVQDTGDGIDNAIATRIFDPFFTTKPPGSGTGLGLTISYGIVRDHGGRLDFLTERGKGTTFRVLLPIRQKRADKGGMAHGEAAAFVRA